MISAVIISLNEERNIRRTISCLSDNRITEIIIIDSNSTDKTAEIINDIDDKRIKLVIYTEPPFTAARGRAEGSKLIDTNNDYILFLDGDMEYDSTFTDIAIDFLTKDDKLAGIMGQRKDVFYDGLLIVGEKDNVYDLNRFNPGGGMFLKSYDYFKTPGFKKELESDEEGFLYSYYKMNRKYFKRISQRMFTHHTEVAMSKEKILLRFKSGRLTGLGRSLYYSLEHPFLLFDFIRRRKNEVLTGILFCILPFSFHLYTIPLAFSLFLFLIIRFKGNFRLLLIYGSYFIAMIAGFIHCVYVNKIKNCI